MAGADDGGAVHVTVPLVLRYPRVWRVVTAIVFVLVVVVGVTVPWKTDRLSTVVAVLFTVVLTLSAVGAVQLLTYRITLAENSISIRTICGSEITREYSEIQGIATTVDGQVLIFFREWYEKSPIGRFWERVLDELNLSRCLLSVPRPIVERSTLVSVLRERSK